MTRNKQREGALAAARRYLDSVHPELQYLPLHLHMLDGPPGGARYAVTVELCTGGRCPHPRPPDDPGGCPVLDCPLRRTQRILIDGQGRVLQSMASSLPWG